MDADMEAKKNDFGSALRQALAEHPDYPLIVMADTQDCNPDYDYAFLPSITVEVGEYLAPAVEPQPREDFIYTSRDELRQDLADEMDGLSGDPSGREFEAELDREMAKFEPFWRDCIIIWASA